MPMSTNDEESLSGLSGEELQLRIAAQNIMNEKLLMKAKHEGGTFRDKTYEGD